MRPHTDPDFTPESGYTLAEPITFTPLPESHDLCVYGPGPRLLVTVDTRTGTVSFGEGVTPNEAARVFWEAVSHAAPEAPAVREAKAQLLAAAVAWHSDPERHTSAATWHRLTTALDAAAAGYLAVREGKEA